MLRHVLAHACREHVTPDQLHCMAPTDDVNPESKDQLPSTYVSDLVQGEVNGEQPRVRIHIASFIATYRVHTRTTPSEKGEGRSWLIGFRLVCLHAPSYPGCLPPRWRNCR